MKNNKKSLFIALPVIVVICLICILSINGKSDRIDGIDNYGNVFKNVEEIKFFIGENNFYSTRSPSKDLKTLKKVKLKTEPISDDRSKDRDFEHKIIINNSFAIYINKDFSELWLDDTENININYNGTSWDKETDEGILPSFSYMVENPEILGDLFQQ